MLGFRFDLVDDGRWAELDLSADSDDWAADEAAKVCAAAGLPAGSARERDLAASLAVAARTLPLPPPVAAMALSLEPAGPPVAIVEVHAAADPDLLGSAVVDRLLPPDPVGRPEIDPVDTAAGPATRLHTRFREVFVDETGRALGEPIVLEQLLYLWALPAERSVLVAAVTFDDLVEAGRAVPFVDALAHGLEIVP